MSAIYLRKRRLPTYSDLGPDYSGRWNQSFEFNHNTPSRGKYRKVDGITVYESGYVEVAPYVHRNPALRHKLACKYGLVFLPPKECSGVKFFTPNGVPVAACAITTDMLFLDGQTRRAYSYESKYTWNQTVSIREDAKIDFAAPGAVPVAHAQVKADLPNLSRVSAVMKEHKEFFKVCATTALLMSDNSIGAAGIVPSNTPLGMLLSGEEVDFAAIPLSAQVCIGEYVAGKAEVGIRARLTALSTKPYSFPYLNIVLGDGNG